MKSKDKVLILNVSSCDQELCGFLGSVGALHQKAGIQCAHESGRATELIERIAAVFELSQMVDKDNGDAALIRDALERRNVLVIGGVHVAVGGVGFSHLLQRVDDDQLRVRVFAQMLFDLFLQTAMQLF